MPKEVQTLEDSSKSELSSTHEIIADRLVHEYEKEEFDASEYRKVEDEMKQATAEEEEYWRCKSRVSWLKLGR